MPEPSLNLAAVEIVLELAFSQRELPLSQRVTCVCSCGVVNIVLATRAEITPTFLAEEHGVFARAARALHFLTVLTSETTLELLERRSTRSGVCYFVDFVNHCLNVLQHGKLFHRASVMLFQNRGFVAQSVAAVAVVAIALFAKAAVVSEFGVAGMTLDGRHDDVVFSDKGLL